SNTKLPYRTAPTQTYEQLNNKLTRQLYTKLPNSSNTNYRTAPTQATEQLQRKQLSLGSPSLTLQQVGSPQSALAPTLYSMSTCTSLIPKAVMLNYKQVQAFVAAMLVLAMTAAAIEGAGPTKLAMRQTTLGTDTGRIFNGEANSSNVTPNSREMASNTGMGRAAWVFCDCWPRNAWYLLEMASAVQSVQLLQLGKDRPADALLARIIPTVADELHPVSAAGFNQLLLSCRPRWPASRSAPGSSELGGLGSPDQGGRSAHGSCG
uniref:Secreted protein n=1 Tax=Macrostomum lignano TaxID=282301 RepID=A0A1I8FGA5_9PLAT